MSTQLFQHSILRKARRDSRLSQQELAEAMDVHRNTVARWESGLGEPSEEQMERICKLLQRDAGYFFVERKTPGADSAQDAWLRQVPVERLQELAPDALRRLRRIHGFSVGTIAEKVGVPNSYVRDWITKRRVVNLAQLNRLREAFGEKFDPTPILKRKAAQRPGPADPAETMVGVLRCLESISLTLRDIYRLLEKNSRNA